MLAAAWLSRLNTVNTKGAPVDLLDKVGPIEQPLSLGQRTDPYPIFNRRIVYSLRMRGFRLHDRSKTNQHQGGEGLLTVQTGLIIPFMDKKT